MIKDKRRIDKETLREIFRDHWDAFKRKHPSYDNAEYDEVVKKMLGCGTPENGYVFLSPLSRPFFK